MFTAMLKKSRRNLQACTEVGLIEHVLNLMSDADDVIAGTSLKSFSFKISVKMNLKRNYRI